MYIIDSNGSKVLPAECFRFYPVALGKSLEVDNMDKVKNKALQDLLLKLMKSDILIESYVRQNTDFDNKGVKL
ncbi:hypothetical protein [Salinicola aestuarinus]|uniref:hypothetical protein n=1 Tax=Salinicola aestuarinus TaxID=1949082 RepID=UPI00130072E1|nr:hypothetical protein [Salinicola aestuarinus]